MEDQLCNDSFADENLDISKSVWYREKRSFPPHLLEITGLRAESSGLTSYDLQTLKVK